MILDKLIATTLLCFATGIDNIDIREPNRRQEESYSVYNGLDVDFYVYSHSEDEEYLVPAQSHIEIEHNTFYKLNIIVPDWDWDAHTNVWYAFFDGPDIPQTPIWDYTSGGTSSYFTTIAPPTENNSGIGVYYEKYLPWNTDFYIDSASWGGVTHGLNDWTGTIELLPPNSTIRLYKNDGSYSELNNLKVRRANVENSSSYDVLIYSEISTNNYLMIANNKGYNREYFNGFSTTSDPTKLQPYIKYYNNYTNRIRFTSGMYERYAQSPNGLGYQELSYLTEQVTGFVGYNEGGVDEAVVTLTTGMGLVASSFMIVSSFFGYMIFPGISLGLLLCVPIIIELILVIIKMIKKG